MTPVETLRLRAELKTALRDFFGQRDSLEIDTPIAVVQPGTEVHLRYFPTVWLDHRGAEHPLYLRSSPELHMKQALALGLPRVFQIAPCFRSGGELADWHHPEFTMLEWYEAGISYEAFIGQTEDLLRATLDRLTPLVAKLGGTPLNLPVEVPRITVAEAFERFASLKLVDQDPDLGKMAKAAGSQSAQPGDDFETAFFKVCLDKVEPALKALGCAVLTDYPRSQAALATVRGSVAKRFEFYVQGVELSNGFEELLAPELNRQRIAEANARRRALGYETPEIDHDFDAALVKGLPPSCGNALGFDRWLALIMGENSIDHAVPFRQAQIYGR